MISYKCEDYYLFRTTLKSVSTYFKIFYNNLHLLSDLKFINYIKEDPFFMNSIKISSKELYNSLENVNESTSSKKLRNIRKSIVKYIIRMCSRCTPFGTFSGVDIGYFTKNKSNIFIRNMSQHNARFRPDMEWIYSLVKILEKDNDIFIDLKLKFNDICYAKGGRIVNNFPSISVKSSNGEVKSVRKTENIDLIMRSTQNFTSVSDIIKLLKENNTNTDENTIKDFIKKLLENDFLYSNLRPPLSNIPSLQYIINIIEKFKKIPEIFFRLVDINKELTELNSFKLEEQLLRLDKLINNMNKVLKIKNNPIQVDLKITTESNKTNINIKNDIEETVNVLINLSSHMGYKNNLEEYKRLFIEKYGYEQSVNILELLDDDIGLGSPSGYTNPISQNINLNMDKHWLIKDLENFIINKTIISKKSIDDTIEISDFIDNKDFFESNNGAEFHSPISLDIGFSVLSTSSEDIEKGNYKLKLSSNLGSTSAGNISARFSDIIDKNKVMATTIYNKQKSSLPKNIEIVEICETPKNKRHANLKLNNNCIESQIVIGAAHEPLKNQVSVKDIYIGIDINTNKFVIYNLKTNSEIVVYPTNMLNTSLESNVTRLLQDISSGNSANYLDIMYSLDINNLSYVPKILYKKTILKPKTWKINQDDIKKIYISDQPEIELKNWIKKWNVPRYVYYKKTDQCLLIDLENDFLLKELASWINPNEFYITLVDATEDLENLWITDSNENKYFGEWVVSLFVDNNSKIKESNNINKLKVISLSSEKRNIEIGDENWIYIKLYCEEERQNEFLNNIIFSFCNKFKSKLYKWFYIRYKDKEWGFHFRLRLKANSYSSFLEILDELIKLISQSSKMGLLKHYSIERYLRELERYGFEESIDIAESCFFRNSVYVCEYIRNSKKMCIDESFAIFSIIKIMLTFNLNIEEQINLLRKVVKDRAQDSEFRLRKKELSKVVNAALEDEIEYSSNHLGISNGTFLSHKNQLSEYYNYLCENEVNLSTSISNILLSLIHMFCNRCKGNREWENRIMRYTLYCLEDYFYSNKNKERG